MRQWNVFINTVVRRREIPFKISAEIDPTSQRALEALYAPHPETPELTLDEINEEIRKARQERRERLERENAEKHWSASGYSGAIFQWIFEIETKIFNEYLK